MIYIYLIIRLLDIVTTTIGVGSLGCWEVNPYMRFLIGTGIWNFVLINGVVSLLVGYIFSKNLDKKLWGVSLLLFTIVNGIIVVGNFTAIWIALSLG